MTNEEFDYYLISDNGEPGVPLLQNNDEIDPDGIDPIYYDEYVEIVSPVYLALNPPYPAKPNFKVDYLEVPSAVYSNKIHAVLAPLNVKGFNLLPCIIVDRKGEEHSGFWLEHAYKRITCIDTGKSGCRYIPFGDTWTNFKKIVLDIDLLKAIPLEERLIFRPKETREFVLYHKSIVDKILESKPINIQFVSVDDWVLNKQ